MGTELHGKEQMSMSRLEYALRLCCSPGKTVRFYVNDAMAANTMYNRICELIPRKFIKRYGLMSVIFENDSKIEVACR